jgi:hypothetical protein
MTEIYLQSLGFESTLGPERGSRAANSNATWRYRHTNAAQDGTYLYAEHPMGIPRCRLSTIPAPLDQRDVLLDTELDNHAALETAISGFFAAHGGVGMLIGQDSSNTYRPYRRKE